MIILLVFVLLGVVSSNAQEVLNPPYFNLAEGRKIVASATCGVGVNEPELYCKLVGANTDSRDNPNINLIQGQVCDYCDPSNPNTAHPAEHAIDGTEKWYQSPPLSRGMKYNEVNLTIDLGQEFHVAYVFIKMGNSPRPGVWVLERSTNDGETFAPWQYFADSPGDCVQMFGPDALQQRILKDDTVICETKFSKVVPLVGGEIVVSLLNDRPNADNFSYSMTLQEWTKATNIRLRFLRTKTLLGHLMSVARQDPTVTRRYFYSIKDINIGGRCVCNGHAETCDLTDPRDPYKLLCRCQHNTCGPNCEQCCPGFKQKKWRRAILQSPFVCEPCNCFGHSNECVYDEETDRNRLSLDIYGHYEGGGICQNCRHNTQGVNCNQCKPTFYRPYGKPLNATDVCQPCNCDLAFSTGNCADGTGQCECRPEFLPPYCDDCNIGYYGYPACKLCDCHPNGTYGNVCEVGGGQCPCKSNYGGRNCDTCQEGFFGFPDCIPCNCNPSTSVRNICEQEGGQCPCRGNYGGRQCDKCRAGYFNYPTCDYCSCDPTGCVAEICDSLSGACLCKTGYGGPSCDRCAPGYFGYPVCEECKCNKDGSFQDVCDISGRCQCLPSFSGLKCDQCSPGYYDFPRCHPCDCESVGSNGVSCDSDGQCVCHKNFDGSKCDHCKEGFYNYPYCEECNCDPSGVLSTFEGCGSVTSGKLCECKERVTGRICNECKSLYWNLKLGNPLGCEDCNCYLGGTAGGIAVCAKTNGQCSCKPNVGSRQCSECKDGYYQLEDNNLFGCKDCGCDIGGSVNNFCEKESGQCACRPRISGRKCDEPLQTHFFPTLFQHQFEIEDGRTPVGTQVRYGYEESVFPRFSWRGYAVFSSIQKEVLLDLYIEKPSLYQVFFYYLNFGGEPVYGTITFTPEKFGDIQQSSDMVFETTTKPKFMKVSGKQGLIASPFVLNPGRWTVSLRIEKPLFLDYMVLLPQSYYEATLLQQHVLNPCLLQSSNEEMCLMYRFPPLPINAEIAKGNTGYVLDEYGEEKIRTNTYDETETLSILQTDRMAWLDSEQKNLHLDFTVSRPGPHVIIMTYHTPQPIRSTTATVKISDSDQGETKDGKVTLSDCGYSYLCRQVVLNEVGEVLIFDLESNYVTAKMEILDESDIAVDNIALVPADLWHLDYIVPQPLCIKKDGACIESEYPPAPEATKVEFQESGYNEYSRVSDVVESDIALVSLQENDNVVDLKGSVPSPGLYSFVLHYYQPEHSAFKAKVVVQTDDFQEGVLNLAYCPRTSGCRTVARSKETDSTAFHVVQDFHLNIRQPNNKTVWLAYVLVVPAREFQEDILEPMKQDMAGKFITECGQNSFLLPSDVTGFCRESAFSLTSEYNNGALPCKCDTDGSLSYECESFGGQCQCKPNVIGRTCSQCRTGFFGFPNCKPCDCPSTAYCQPVTGQCICPPRVMGDKCDTCVPYTYGFDPIIGCEECNCNPLGTLNGQLQCDLSSGQCRCKSNIVGRTCDKCKAGYWAFPHCQLCNCDLRGSTEDICEQDSARCFCKENVYGDSCDQCKPGTFYLEEVNPLGCTKCFCFGATDRCSSGYLFSAQVYTMSGWDKKVFTMKQEMMEVEGVPITLTEDVKAVLPLEWPQDDLFYFSAPKEYLGNKLNSYGGKLSYVISIQTDEDSDVESFVGPDVILMGNNITIVHVHVEEPAANILFGTSVDLLEREFRHISGREVSREQMMMVLVNLEHLLLRGSYFHPAEEIKLSRVVMEGATEDFSDGPQVLRVEQCQCPPNYRGNSCEKCAPGYYRSKTGPYLGYCVPCQCYGHAQTCDVNTGKCIGCEHNTVGDHCEKCAAGYHGDSTRGTPYDCLICACPLPLESNNFAESCEVSPSGQEISCNCKPEYYGPRCEYCAIGYFGRPEMIGGHCQPCKCSGNIDPSRPGSCDSVTGDCIMCLNNTFGAACELCAPGYFGDAISAKDCRKCKCDECGTRDCDHESGECICWANVIGTSCDRCKENHWGFDSCSGCRPCNCGPASESDQCDLQTGSCRCRPGASGITCDVCEPGYWQYSENGCISCNCVEKYSSGVMCNSFSGQCECLPGVIGEKCDSCPYRWVFVKKQGCYECGACVHGLLDTTDDLENSIAPITEEMKDVSLSYFANKRLQNVNETADILKLGLDAGSSSGFDYSPLVYEVQLIEKNADTSDRWMTHLHSEALSVRNDADSTKSDALEVENLIKSAIGKVRDIIKELGKLSEGLEDSVGEEDDIDTLVAQAEYILEDLLERNFDSPKNDSLNEYDSGIKLLEEVTQFELPVLENKERCEEQGEKLMHVEDLLDDLTKDSQNAYNVADDAQALHEEMEGMSVEDKLQKAEMESKEINIVLKNASELLQHPENDLTASVFRDLGLKSDRLAFGMIDLKDQLKDTEQNFQDTKDLVNEASEHAKFLKDQADQLEESLSDTRDSSEAAVKAANAYANIGEAINDAYLAAESALTASQSAETMSDGVLGKTTGSKDATNQLIDSAFLLDREVTSLKPQLQKAREGVLLIGYQNGKTEKGLDAIKKDLEKLPLYSLGVLAEVAANNSAIADELGEKAIKKLESLTDNLPKDEKRAHQIPKDVEEAKQAIKAGHSYADRVSSILPETNVLAERVGKRKSALKIIGTDVSEKLAKLQQKIAVARTQANRIKLGVQFFENTTLQLRNPEGLQKAATYTHLSLYFKTTERYGLLAFIGNEKGAHNRMKNVITDDYLALEIRAGLLVLIMDIGSGSEIINHGTYVSDGRWHQVIIERTGKTCSITVRTDKEEDSVVEGFLPGTYSVFNLDPKVSKFFIGGIKENPKLPDTLQNFHFDGCIEDVQFGDTPVGLWDFVWAENNFEGCAERTELTVLQPSNGLRFNGAGYAILPSKKHKFAKTSVIKLQFKTYAQHGLLFLIGKNKEYFAVDMVDGHIHLAYDLGSGPLSITSEETYNDGKWHSLDASRFDKNAVLKVDEVEVGKGSSPGNENTLSFTNQMFIGGYPRSTHSYPGVSSTGFEGCIMDLQIGATNINLNQNEEALGVVNGCPVTIARTVSFSNDSSSGYIAMPPVQLGNLAQLTFKFKTTEENGLIFYASNEAQDSYLSISLRNGAIFMTSVPGGEIKTNTKYNDREWHYVSATKALRQMRLDIDDIHSVEIELSEDASVVTTTPLYFAGTPNGIVGVPAFVGCIGDTTVNNKFQNFADAIEMSEGASLASCPLGDPEEEASRFTTEDHHEETASSTSAPVEEEEEEPVYFGSCSLPLYPRRDKSVKSGDGIRFGNTVNSREELSKPNSFMDTIQDDSTFALEFRTNLQTGIMFYVSDTKHIDYVALLLQNGKIVYVFNCGSGSSMVSSQKTYNDGTWHRVVFSRRGKEGRLVVDDEEEVRGASQGTASSMNVKSPFYVGGLSEEVAREAKNNVKGITLSFPGCIRNVEAQGEMLQAASTLSQNVTACSDKVEEGAYFSAHGGHLILFDKYRVGQRVSITLDIKPRNLSGILMAVHGKVDYLILQMVDGRVEISVDNGAGPITSSFIPTDEHYLCDGEWHTVQVVKSNNFVTLSLDGIFSDPGIGVGGVSATDTNDPLYIGGVPESSFSKRGVLTTDHFVGCMRYLELDSKPQQFEQSRVVGHVTMNTCPTI
ncbi:laminin subunit alpha isoform X1 [Parasteatoda tepidariorum]|nr:laminin subunit alpha isoform X1 [Parasteatoda tepidariorum]